MRKALLRMAESQWVRVNQLAGTERVRLLAGVDSAGQRLTFCRGQHGVPNRRASGEANSETMMTPFLAAEGIRRSEPWVNF